MPAGYFSDFLVSFLLVTVLALTIRAARIFLLPHLLRARAK